MSSLNKLSVKLLVSLVALVTSPKVIIIVSIISTSVSSFPFVEIVAVPVVCPAAIVIGESVIVYSLDSAVPLRLYSIVVIVSEGADKVAVKVTSDDEFSSIDSELRANDTDGIVSSLVTEILIGSEELNVPLTGVDGENIMVSGLS